MKEFNIAYFNKIETILIQMEEFKSIVALLVNEFLEAEADILNEEELISRYTYTQLILNTIYDLMCYKTHEMREFLDNHITD